MAPSREYSKTQIGRAGDTLSERPLSSLPVEEREIVDYWRSLHGYPLNTFQTNLRRWAKDIDTSALIAQRTKRLVSVKRKLELNPQMKLSRMHDIAGCRVVVQDIKSVRQLERTIVASRTASQLARTYDYIADPKVSGYRGVHLVFKHASKAHPLFNGLLVEIQLRTEMQHAWATTVETISMFTDQALKSNIGEGDWLRFFSLMSALIAEQEESPDIPGTPPTIELERELCALIRSLRVRQRLAAYQVVVDNLDEISGGVFVLDLDTEVQSLRVTSFGRSSEAELHYQQLERDSATNPRRDIVMVRATSVAALRKAYPNYFADTTRFADLVEEVIDNDLSTPTMH